MLPPRAVSSPRIRPVTLLAPLLMRSSVFHDLKRAIAAERIRDRRDAPGAVPVT